MASNPAFGGFESTSEEQASLLFFLFFSSVTPQKLTQYLKRYHTHFNSYAAKFIIHTILRYLTSGVHNVITQGHYLN